MLWYYHSIAIYVHDNEKLDLNFCKESNMLLLSILPVSWYILDWDIALGDAHLCAKENPL